MDRFYCTSRFSYLTIVALALMMTASCLPRGTDLASLYRPESAPLPTQTQVSFALLKAEVLTRNCIKCHSNYDTENGVLKDIVPGDPEHSILYQTIETGSMPPGGPRLRDGSLAIVRRYIQGLGSPQDTPLTPEPSPSPSPNPKPGFDILSTRIIKPYCITCHKSFSTEKGISAYIVKGDPEHSSFYRTVVEGMMPPDGPQLSASDQELIRTYILDLTSQEADVLNR